MILLFMYTQQTAQLIIPCNFSGYNDYSFKAPKPCSEELCVTVVLRDNTMHKTIQDDTIATQTSDYILAQPRTISS